MSSFSEEQVVMGNYHSKFKEYEYEGSPQSKNRKDYVDQVPTTFLTTNIQELDCKLCYICTCKI